MRNIDMKLTLFILLFNQVVLFAQELRYDMYLYDSCMDSIYLCDGYSLYFENIPDSISESTWFCNNHDKPCKFPSLGTYVLGISDNIHDIPFILTFDQPKIYSDTFRISSITERIGTTTAGGYYGFYCCEELCDGEIVEYFNNHQISFKGSFDNGIPNNNLYYYYRNGNVKEMHYYTRRHRYIRVEYYNPEGDLTRIEKKGFKVKVYDPFKRN